MSEIDLLANGQAAELLQRESERAAAEAEKRAESARSEARSHFETELELQLEPVSYTHLTLPTIYSV